MPSDETLVLAANQTFYDAFARGDFPAVEALWARHAPVACIHPGWDAIVGREEVVQSFRSILSGGSGPGVRCTRPVAQVIGDTAYVLCGEEVDGAELIATNLFVREDGTWKIVHHQAGPVRRRHRPDEGPPSGGPRRGGSKMLN